MRHQHSVLIVRPEASWRPESTASVPTIFSAVTVSERAAYAKAMRGARALNEAFYSHYRGLWCVVVSAPRPRPKPNPFRQGPWLVLDGNQVLRESDDWGVIATFALGMRAVGAEPRIVGMVALATKCGAV